MAGRALSFLAASLLLLGVLLPTNVVAAPADKDGHVVPTAIHDRARAEGEVRVLVELLLPSGRVAEGAVPNQARALYRQEITDAAARLLSRLTQHPHRVLRRYVTAPLIALEAGPTALQALDASSSLVKRVTEDRIHTPALLDSVPPIGADTAGGLDQVAPSLLRVRRVLRLRRVATVHRSVHVRYPRRPRACLCPAYQAPLCRGQHEPGRRALQLDLRRPTLQAVHRQPARGRH